MSIFINFMSFNVKTWGKVAFVDEKTAPKGVFLGRKMRKI